MATKLWSKTAKSHESILVHQFTAGNDRQLDLKLARHDVMATMAHVSMLEKIKLLSANESKAIIEALQELLYDINNCNFKIDDDCEDVHSHIEFYLTNKLGETGKKIHAGRSRNDQVLVAIKLYLREECVLIMRRIEVLFNTLIALAGKNKDHLLPGYTHLQIAMPSSFGLWFSAYAEALGDDVSALHNAYYIADKNPLGSAAGYGTSFPVDRDLTTDLLNMSAMHYNVVYAQMSRGKTEKWMADAMAAIAATLSKLAYDCCLYMGQDFGFIRFPDHLTTGSSIMPHKKNPDVFELIRGKCNIIQATPVQLNLLLNNLPSGYHRDFQLTKACLFPAIDELKSCLGMMNYMLQHIEVQPDLLSNKKYDTLFSVEAVNQMVMRGESFREAYKAVGKSIEEHRFVAPRELQHTHKGSMGNLCLDKICDHFNEIVKKFDC